MARSEITDADRDEVARFIESRWHSRLVMSQGKKFYPHEERGFIERRNDLIAGLLTMHIGHEGMEILTLDSTLEGAGIGSSLMLHAIECARKEKCHKVTLTTTNDRLRAIGFYQRLGFRMVKINAGVVDIARATKPEIPEIGERGIPIHDEVVMELSVKPYLEE